jgi:glycine cleavage system H protein
MKVEEYCVPENLLYTESHEWTLIDSSEKVIIGITDYAQKTLHDIVFVETPEEGIIIKRTEPLGTVESVKAVSEIFSPFTGKVIKVNKKLEMNPELVNQDPYGNGWVAQIQPNNLKKESDKLLTPPHYAEYLKKILHK